MAKKYELLKTCTLERKGKTLYAICALKDFGDVKKDMIGGWIESEENLSQSGNCWVYDNAMVTLPAKVCENATVHNYAQVIGNSVISGNATVRDNAVVSNASVMGDATIKNDVCIIGGNKSIVIKDSAILQDSVSIRQSGDILIQDNVVISGYTGFRTSWKVEPRENATVLKGNTKLEGTNTICGGTFDGDCTIVNCVIEGNPSIIGKHFIKNITIRGNAKLSERVVIQTPHVVIGDGADLKSSKDCLFFSIPAEYGVTFCKGVDSKTRMYLWGHAHDFNSVKVCIKDHSRFATILTAYWNAADMVLTGGEQQLGKTEGTTTDIPSNRTPAPNTSIGTRITGALPKSAQGNRILAPNAPIGTRITGALPKSAQEDVFTGIKSLSTVAVDTTHSRKYTPRITARLDIKPGQKYGDLTVISEADPIVYTHPSGTKRYRAFKCKCVCGKLRVVRLSDLRAGRVKSCGCRRDATGNECLDKNSPYKKSRYVVKPGQVFGYLTVIRDYTYRNQRTKRSYRLVECKCVCGRIHTVRINHLVLGRTKSCGCRGLTVVHSTTNKEE